MSRNRLRITAAALTGALIIAVMAACGKVQTPPDINRNESDIESTPVLTEPPQSSQQSEIKDSQQNTTEPAEPVSEPELEHTEAAEANTDEPEDTEQSDSDKTDSSIQSGIDYAKIVDTASAQLGVPYKHGGSNPDDGFDSSGFTYYCVKQAGLDFPRSLTDQLESGVLIPYADLRAGDIVYFSTDCEEADFCGVYVGGGLMIYSPVPDDFVKTANITTNYWTTHFVTGLRVG